MPCVKIHLHIFENYYGRATFVIFYRFTMNFFFFMPSKTSEFEI